MSGPKWFLNVTKYGHLDFLDTEYREIGKLMCSSCKSNCDYAAYRTLLKEAVLSFYDAMINSSPIALKII